LFVVDLVGNEVHAALMKPMLKVLNYLVDSVLIYRYKDFLLFCIKRFFAFWMNGTTKIKLMLL